MASSQDGHAVRRNLLILKYGGSRNRRVRDDGDDGCDDICWTQVSAAENMRFPIMGEIMLAFQTIFVDRDSQTSGRGAAQLIAATLEDKRFPQVGGGRMLQR